MTYYYHELRGLGEERQVSGGVTGQLGRDMAGTLDWLMEDVRLRDHPQVERRARWLLLDTLACAAAGFAEEAPVAYAARLAALSPGPVAWPGCDAGLSALAAASVAPMAACWHEACEGLARAHGRPGLHAVPVAAALGVQRGATLGDVLEAIVWGYEIGGRAGEAMRIRPGLHVDGTWGVFAAAAAAARAARLDRAACLQALAAAACQMQVSLYAPVRQGRTVRNTYVGQAASRAILLVEALAAGIDAPVDVFDEAALQLGDPPRDASARPWCAPGEFLILQSYLKPFAGVRHAHYAAEAARRWHRAHGPDTGAIRALVLDTYPEALAYCGIRAPRLALQAQFSLSYATAHALLRGGLGPDAYRADTLRDPELRRLESLVELRTDRGEARGATLRVVGDAGDVAIDVEHVAGDGALPFDEAQVRDKALAYLQPALGRERALRLADHVLDAACGESFTLHPAGAPP